MVNFVESSEGCSLVKPTAKETFLIVDPIPLRGALWMRAIEEYKFKQSLKLIVLNPHQPSELIPGEYDDCRLVLLNIGECPLRVNTDFKNIIKQLPKDRNIPIVLLSDREDPEDVRDAICARVQGLIPGSLSLTMALEAIGFVLNGGCYFPTSAINELVKPKETNGSQIAQTHVQLNGRFHDGDPDGDRNGLEEPAPNDELTDRQREVLALIAQGLSNKLIARRLGMQEGTVKVHVRFIMRKFGAANRTQVALYSQSIQAAKKPTIKTSALEAVQPPSSNGIPL